MQGCAPASDVGDGTRQGNLLGVLKGQKKKCETLHFKDYLQKRNALSMKTHII